MDKGGGEAVMDQRPVDEDQDGGGVSEALKPLPA